MPQCALCPAAGLLPAGGLKHFWACPSCGLIHHLRSHDRQAEEARYEGVVFDTPASVAAQQWKWLQAMNRGPVEAGKRLLDVGCGSGSFLVQAEAQGLSVAGTDISAAAVHRAAERLSAGAQLHAGSLGGAGLVEPFDFITLWDVLDHLDDPRAELIRIRSLLKPGGLLALRVRNGPLHLKLRAAEMRVRGWLKMPPRRDYLGVVHRYGFNVHNLGRLLQETGFRGELQRTDVTTGERDRTTGAGSWIRPLKRALVAAAEVAGRLTGHRFYPAPSLLFAARAAASGSSARNGA